MLVFLSPCLPAGRGRGEGVVREFRNISWRKVGRTLKLKESHGKII
jgi:hypothetical protein